MNCLNTVGSGICINVAPPIPLVATITGIYTATINDSLYTYTFNPGTYTMKFNTNITDMYVIVVGGGGGGMRGNGGFAGGCGGAGGGFGFWKFSYTGNDSYTVTVGKIKSFNNEISADIILGNTSSFLSGGIGVSATGGECGVNNGYNYTAKAGTFNKTGNAPGFITQRTGGNGSNSSGGNGGDSSGPITVLGNTYNYGGGGKGGTSSNTRRGGKPGENGNGGTGTMSGVSYGGDATTAGSGGGGGSAGGQSFQNGGQGGPGLIIVTFNYP